MAYFNQLCTSCFVGIMQKFYYVPSDSKLEILVSGTLQSQGTFSPLLPTKTIGLHLQFFLFLWVFIIHEEISNWGNNILRSNRFIFVLLCCSIIIAGIICSDQDLE